MQSEGLYKEKGSKFIALATPCLEEHQAKILLDDWRKEHHQARHLCYAYRFGLNGEIYRANDDGEPTNSAGAPILGQIKSFELTNILIGVVRYFGGTKLGVGGLMNAYKEAAREAIEAGEIVEREVFDRIRITFSYEQMPEIMNFIKRSGVEPEVKSFQEEAELYISLPIELAEEIKKELKGFKSLKLTELGIF